jgi:DNA-binding PucR family transcriptional regulator
MTRPSPADVDDRSPVDGTASPTHPAAHVEEYLELLLEDAAAIDYERPLARARATGATGDTLAALARIKVLALEVREAFAARRRRESELSALFDTAGDLAAARSVDSVLTAIVRRARQLLGTDVSYLTLHDDVRGDTYVRVTDGSVSARFQSLRLPMGTGLGGLVAQTSAPYSTPSYFTDRRFRHADDVDAGVAEEGLVAILGVPLIRGSRVIGVLFASDRSERPFERSEIALLSSLAAHAAIALDNARLLEETRAALAELSVASEELRARTAAVERAAEAHDRFIEVVLRGGSADDIAAIVAESLDARLIALDEDGRVSPTAGTDLHLFPPDLTGCLERARATGRTAREGNFWTAAVMVGRELLGGLVAHRDHELSGSDQRLLERAALVTALLVLIRRTASEAESRVRDELLEDLLSLPVRDEDAVRERARRLGADLDHPQAVVVARVAEGTRDRSLARAVTLAAAHRGLAALHDGLVVLCLPDLSPGAAADLVCRELAATGGPVTAGGGGPVQGPSAVAAAHAEAARCLSALVSLGRTGQSAGAEELGFFGLLVSERRDVRGFVAGALGPLLEYDTRRGTDLTGTLRAYFEAGNSAARAAGTLGVHVNTVNQRLERVAHLLGKDWSAPDRALEIQLALKLHRLAGPADG